jgi:hypothetical protein
VQVGNEYICGKKYRHIKLSPGEIQTPAHWNLIGGNMADPLCYSPAVFFRYLRFIPRSFAQVKNSALVEKHVRFLILFTLFKNA